MNLNTIYQEPCLETLKRIPDGFIDCVITSPPYWQLRDYGYNGQWGLEPTYQDYLEHLWQMMDEIYRVLKPMGTTWINLGDSYSTQSGTNAALAKGTHKKQDSTYLTNRGESGNLIKDISLPSKCLLLIPHRFAIGCIDRGWIVRNDIIWAKRNGMPESITDRFSKKHEYIFFMVKQPKYYFDLDAIRDPTVDCGIRDRTNGKYKKEGLANGLTGKPPIFHNRKVDAYFESEYKENPNGKNPGSVSDFWDITLKPSGEKHYAAYNDELLKKPVLAGCPEGGIIYDPFMGTGTTAIVAERAGRKWIGSEMSKEYCDIAQRRLKQFENKLF